MTESFST